MNPQTGRGTISGTAKRGIVLVILMISVGLFILFLIAKETPRTAKIIREGDLAPEFRLPSPDGKLSDLSEYRGRVVMLHFWATWCPPCVDEIPTLERLYRTFSGKDFELLAVSADEDGAEAVTPFMRRNGLTLPVLLDPNRSIAKLYGTFKYPETYILDRNGIVRYKAIGARDWTAPENIEIIREIISAK